MPKKNDDRDSASKRDGAAQEERFRNFFSTSVVDVPAEMTRRDEEKKEKSRGVLGRLLGHGTAKEELQEAPGLEIPTGEILLGADAKPEKQADLDLMLRTADPVPDLPLCPPEPEKPTEPTAETPVLPPEIPPEMLSPRRPEVRCVPDPDTAVRPVPVPDTEKPRIPEVKVKPTAPEKKLEKKPEPKRKAAVAPQVLLPQEQQEQQELNQFKEMLKGMSRPERSGTQPPRQEKSLPAADPEQEKAPEPAPAMPEVIFAASQKKESEKKSVFQMFGVGEDEKQPEPSQPEPPKKKEDTLSLPLVPLGEETGETEEPAVQLPGEPEAAGETVLPAGDAPEQDAQPPLQTEAEDALPAEEPEEPESTGDRLHRMSAELTLRCVLAGVLGVVLLHFGLVGDRLLPAMAALDPDAAPAAFYAANLLLYAAALVVGYPVVRDGLSGLRGRPSAETMPALAAVAALLQAVVALLNANTYRATGGLSMLTGVAALGLFLALLGSRILLAAVEAGYEFALEDPELQGACRAKDKDLIRALAKDLEQKDPWVLLSRPRKAEDDFVEQSLGERASERRARKNSYILLAVAVLSGVVCLLKGDANKAVAAMTAVLCMGAPLSSTLIAGLTSLRLQRAAAAVGAVVPGWAAIQELGGIDTIQVDADDLFTGDGVMLEDIRIFKGGRIDRAILYAASVLNQSCETLRGLFCQIVEDRTDILFPVKDLEIHRGLGFTAWCDNNRILIGNRRYMEQEGVALPEEEYEKEHSKDGALQILYLAVSGNLHAMFVLRYVGGRNVARGLAALQRENIRLLVSCQDPSLTAQHITEAYRLPEGMVVLLDQDQCAAVENAADTRDACCMYHAKGFASLTGGLQAADRAQNAETAATTVQMVSVLISVLIVVLLTYSGSIWQLPVTYLLVYQAAWSALSIALGALKQHG